MARPEMTSRAACGPAGAGGHPQAAPVPRRPPLRRLRAVALTAALCAFGALCLLGGCSRLLSIVDPSAF